MLYANVSPDDILLKQKLDVLATSHPNLKVGVLFREVNIVSQSALLFLNKLKPFQQNLQVYYTVDNPTKNWRGGAGYISKDVVVKGLPEPSDDTLILVSFFFLSELEI